MINITTEELKNYFKKDYPLVTNHDYDNMLEILYTCTYFRHLAGNKFTMEMKYINKKIILILERFQWFRNFQKWLPMKFFKIRIENKQISLEAFRGLSYSLNTLYKFTPKGVSIGKINPLKAILSTKKEEDMEKAYLDFIAEMNMLTNLVFKNLFENGLKKNISNISFDANCDFFNKSHKFSKVDLIINYNQKSKIMIECKRISETTFNTSKKFGIKPETLIEEIRANKIDDDNSSWLRAKQKQEDFDKFKKIIFYKINDKLDDNFKQLSTFGGNTCNILYLYLNVESTSKSDTSEMSGFLSYFYMNFNSFYQNKFFDLDLRNLKINYIFIAYPIFGEDVNIVFKCHNNNKIELIYDTEAITNIKTYL